MDNPSSGFTWLFILLFIVLWLFAVVCWFWGVIDLSKLFKPEGKINRGFKIWTRPLRPDLREFLLSQTNDVVEYRKTLFGQRMAGFIRVENKEAVIVYRDAWFRSSFIYIGYVDLNVPDPVLEIHTSLPILLFLVPFVALIVFIPFVVLMLGLGYYIESIIFNRFVDRKINEFTQPVFNNEGGVYHD